jgi:hypothetical protein
VARRRYCSSARNEDAGNGRSVRRRNHDPSPASSPRYSAIPPAGLDQVESPPSQPLMWMETYRPARAVVIRLVAVCCHDQLVRTGQFLNAHTRAHAMPGMSCGDDRDRIHEPPTTSASI